MSHTAFQQRAWAAAQAAHAAADRADARILLRMIEFVDCGDYEALGPLVKALQEAYRQKLGSVPASCDEDAAGA